MSRESYNSDYRINEIINDDIADDVSVDFVSGDSASWNRYKYNIGRKVFEILRNIRVDFEEYLILYALLLASEYHQMNTTSESCDKTSVRRKSGVNLLSISDITNIPRETVRRKVAKLVSEGSITRGADGLHYYSGNAVRDDITAHILEDLPTVRGASAYGSLGDVRQTICKAVGR